MRKFNAMLKMYDMYDFQSYSVQMENKYGNNVFHIVVEKDNKKFDIFLYKTVLYINNIKCLIFSKLFITAMYNEFIVFYKLTK